MSKQILSLDPSRYHRHAIHGEGRTWAETNCYVDVLIELLHALGHEPIAALHFTVAIDFEGDQWTFFKFPHADLCELFGLDIQELAIWRPLICHVEEQIGLGRPVLVELDSFYLPDTAGTAYQREHVKSTVAVNDIDTGGKRLGYFHGQGYYELRDDDFDNVFHLCGPRDPSRLPPYVEMVKRRSCPAVTAEELARKSLSLLRRQLRLLPQANPFTAFKRRFADDLQWLAGEPLETFHQYSFATLRQVGACHELSATYLRWLHGHNMPHLEKPATTFADLSTAAKTLQFQLARALNRKKPMDLAGIDNMAESWQTAMADLKADLL